MLFNKAPSCIVGPNDDIVIPKGSTKTDWEVELAIVIGTRASYVSEDEALRHVAGYCICNDVSEREFQIERAGQWMKGKGCPTFGPLGPWLVTPDEIEDPQKLDMWLDVNGERMQTGSTATMVFGVKKLVSYISQFMIFEPGDVITTGTPPGVGMGKKPPHFLKPGDTVSLGIDRARPSGATRRRLQGRVSREANSMRLRSLDGPRRSRRSTRSSSPLSISTTSAAPGPGSPTCRWCWPPCPSRS